GRSRVSLVRSCVSTYSISSGASITDGIPFLLVPDMRPLGDGGCLVRSTRCAGTACGVAGGTVLTSSLSSCRAPRVPPVGDAHAPCVPRLCRGRLRPWAPLPSEQSKHYASAYGLSAGACLPWQSSRSVRGVGRNKRRGAKSALPICGHPAHGWAPPAVGTPGEGGDDHRHRRRATPWSLPKRQPAPWAVRGVSSSGQDAHASRPAASWYGRRRCWRACRSGVAGAFSSAAPAGKSEGPTAAPSGRRGRTNLSAACSPRRHLAGHGETHG